MRHSAHTILDVFASWWWCEIIMSSAFVNVNVKWIQNPNLKPCFKFKPDFINQLAIGSTQKMVSLLENENKHFTRWGYVRVVNELYRTRWAHLAMAKFLLSEENPSLWLWKWLTLLFRVAVATKNNLFTWMTWGNEDACVLAGLA